MFDVFFAGLLGLFFLPIMLIAAICVKWQFGEVFFRQARPGKNGKTFHIYKFKTMKDLKNDQGQLLPDMERITPLGKFLRESSLDELPELINILKGEMSFVGPRPLLVKYLPLYSPQQSRRHEVLPGITGLAQISGRNSLSWQERFDLDVWYVDHQSIWLDIKILALTIVKVLKREGVNQSQQETMTEFLGNSSKN